MSIAVRRWRSVVFVALLLSGCGSPTPPPAVNTGPPPLPPLPPKVVEAKPAPPPPKVEPDPFETAVGAIGNVFQRFGAIGAEIRDEASADKAVEEMGRLNGRLKELAAEIAKMPRKPSDDKQILALRGDLAQMTTRLSTPASALADPELQLKVLPAQLSVVSEGLVAVEQALLSRQAGMPPQPGTALPPEKLPGK